MRVFMSDISLPPSPKPPRKQEAGGLHKPGDVLKFLSATGKVVGTPDDKPSILKASKLLDARSARIARFKTCKSVSVSALGKSQKHRVSPSMIYTLVLYLAC